MANPKEDKNIDLSSMKPLLDGLPLIIASMLPIAKAYKAKYDALVQEGFTEKQALEIVIRRGISEGE